MQRQSTGESGVGQDRRACRGKAQVIYLLGPIG